MKKFFIFIIFISVIYIHTNIAYAENIMDTSEILEEQEANFGIKDFLEEAEEYSANTMKDLDITELFENAVSGNIDNSTIFKTIISYLGKDLISTFKILINILIIILIHSILKAITDGLENNEISKIVYYVQYILIITVVMSGFFEIIENIKDTIDDLVGFSEILIPLLITLTIYTGSITTSSVIEPILLFLIEFISGLIKKLIIPIVSLIAILMIISKITDKVHVEKIGNLMKSGIVWTLGVILTIFIGVLSLEGTLTASVDGITAKTAKAAVSTIIPVVGKIIGDGVDSILGCGVILKNAVGVVGVIIVLGICMSPIFKLATFSIMYSITSGIIEPLADEKIVKLLSEISGIFKLLLAIICTVSVLLIVGITLVIKISNSGMMYR